jgi:hypothetical protein
MKGKSNKKSKKSKKLKTTTLITVYEGDPRI